MVANGRKGAGMLSVARLSSKLPFASPDGYALSISRQAGYAFNWHRHDCAMLLWPCTGALKSAWSTGPMEDDRAGMASFTLTRGMAVLLPANTAHSTQSNTARQRHGELYLAPELARRCHASGAMHLDASSQAMLEALMSPALNARSAAPLVQALLAQLTGGRPVAPPSFPASPLSELMRLFRQELDADRPLPSVDQAACMLGLSTRSLQRACLRESNLTPVAVRRRMLAEHAVAQLTSGQTLAEVSARCGFANSGHLTRLLKSVKEAAVRGALPHAI